MAQHIKGLLCPWEILSSVSQNVCKASSYGVLPIIPPLVRLREGVPQGKLTGEDQVSQHTSAYVFMNVCMHPCTCEYTHAEYMMLIDQVWDISIISVLETQKDHDLGLLSVIR